MEGAEIFDGDILVVDRSVSPRHGHIVVAFIDGQRLVKRLYQQAGRAALVAENPSYPTLEVREGMELIVWGVVVGKFKPSTEILTPFSFPSAELGRQSGFNGIGKEPELSLPTDCIRPIADVRPASIERRFRPALQPLAVSSKAICC